MAAPVEVVSFLRAHGSGATPWQVKVYALDGAGDGFGGYRVVSAKTAEPVLADELIARLANDGSYASYRCEAPPFGVRIERDGAALSFVADCRVRIDGTRDVAGFSPEMLVFMMKLEATTVPCKWVRLDYFDLEVCVDKTMHYAGGAEMTLLSGITCPQVVISGLHLPGDNTRRIGSVDVSCSHRDSSACAAICDSLRPTPNSTATATFPRALRRSDPPPEEDSPEIRTRPRSGTTARSCSPEPGAASCAPRGRGSTRSRSPSCSPGSQANGPPRIPERHARIACPRGCSCWLATSSSSCTGRPQQSSAPRSAATPVSYGARTRRVRRHDETMIYVHLAGTVVSSRCSTLVEKASGTKKGRSRVSGGSPTRSVSAAA